MTKQTRRLVEARVLPFIEEKCRGYAEKFGWDYKYTRKAVAWMKRAASRKVRKAEEEGVELDHPSAFARKAALHSLKLNREGKLIIPIWKKTTIYGNNVTIEYADKKEAL